MSRLTAFVRGLRRKPALIRPASPAQKVTIAPAPGAEEKPIVRTLPIIDPATYPDDLDTLSVFDGFENPQKWEKALRQAHRDALADPELAIVLTSHFLQE